MSLEKAKIRQERAGKALSNLKEVAYDLEMDDLDKVTEASRLIVNALYDLTLSVRDILLVMDGIDPEGTVPDGEPPVESTPDPKADVVPKEPGPGNHGQPIEEG